MTQALSTFQFDPVTSTPGTSLGSLIPVKRSAEDGHRELSPNSPRALPPAPVPHREAPGEDHVPSSERDEKSPPPLPEEDNGGPFARFFADIRHALGIHATQEALIRSAKACILAAKVMSHRC